MADAQIDYADNVRKYAPAFDAVAVKGIVKHLGIALRSKDSSNVAASDPKELQRVRDGFMKKKLGLTQTDAELDAALKDVMTKMAGERQQVRSALRTRRNNKSVVLCINDRGPKQAARVLDISPAAAGRLGIDRRVMREVTREVVELGNGKTTRQPAR
jgi:hypothetical protein